MLLTAHDDELDQLLKNLQLVEPESDGGNVNCNTLHDDSQASLFETVGPPTDEAHNSETGLAPNEGRHRERRDEGGPCQRPALSPINNHEILQRHYYNHVYSTIISNFSKFSSTKIF